MNYLRLRLTRFGGRGGTSTGARARRAQARQQMAQRVAAQVQANAAAQQAQAQAAAVPVQPAAPTPVPPAAPTAPATNTTVTSDAVKRISSMSDSALANVVQSARGVSMPNQLADRPDVTQQFVYAAGVNEKPMVLNQSDFNKFLKDNHISNSEILARDVNPVSYKNASNTQVKLTAQDVADMMMYSRVNYIGGKVGGQAVGAGTYFARTGGRSSGYKNSNGITVNAVLNPKTAKAIDLTTLNSKIPSWRRSHPKAAAEIDRLKRSVGNNAMFSTDAATSIYALAMGYNVITRGSYVNVIDRSALVYRV